MSKIADFLFPSFTKAYTSKNFKVESIHCFVSKIFPREDLFEISDNSFSVQCTFNSKGLESIRKFL